MVGEVGVEVGDEAELFILDAPLNGFGKISAKKSGGIVNVRARSHPVVLFCKGTNIDVVVDGKLVELVF